MEANLYQKFDALQEQLQKNHVDVVQRLTALETKLAGLPERVAVLESEKARFMGGWSVGAVVLNVLITVFGFLFRRHI